jgi:hypothetical protein
MPVPAWCSDAGAGQSRARGPVAQQVLALFKENRVYKFLARQTLGGAPLFGPHLAGSEGPTTQVWPRPVR